MQEADVRYELDRVTVARMPLTGGLSADEVRDFPIVGTRTGKLASIARSGQPHVAPILVHGRRRGAAELEVVFTTGKHSATGRVLERHLRVSLLTDDQRPLFAFVKLTRTVTISEDLDEVGRWAPRIGGR